MTKHFCGKVICNEFKVIPARLDFIKQKELVKKEFGFFKDELKTCITFLNDLRLKHPELKPEISPFLKERLKVAVEELVKKI